MRQAAAAAKEEEKRLLVERDLEIKKHQDTLLEMTWAARDCYKWLKKISEKQDLLAFVQHRFEVVREETAEAVRDFHIIYFLHFCDFCMLYLSILFCFVQYCSDCSALLLLLTACVACKQLTLDNIR